MFVDDKLTTLDTKTWWDGSQLNYMFYEKPHCPNKDLQRYAALSESSVWCSLNQEVVRRLLCCSDDLSVTEKQQILSTFAQKLRHSCFSVASIQIIMAHGVSKYLGVVKISKFYKVQGLE